MATETIHTGDSIYGGSYAEDSSGNIGWGNTESAALQALSSAQSSEDDD